MKKIPYLFCLICFVFIACGEDPIPEAPPEEVTNIDVALLDGTKVRITWNESKDVNDDEVFYDLVINNLVIDSRVTEGYKEFDVLPLMPLNKSVKKGVNLNLAIKIRAYDSKGNSAEIVEVLRTIYVNRDPKEFSIETLNIDYYNYSYLEVVWNPAKDDDGDLVRYDLYLNNKIIKEDFVINATDTKGYFYYYNNYYQEIKDGVKFKIIAKDGSGGFTEIEKNINHTETDINLSSITTPYQQNHSYQISSNEPDNRIAYHFTLSENVGVLVKDLNNSGVDFIVRDTNGNFIGSNYNILGIPNLDAGTYSLEVNKYGSGSKSGEFTLTIRDSKATDKDLGKLSIPYMETHSFDTSNEPDFKIAYKFEVTEKTGLYIPNTNANTNSNYILKDLNGNYLRSDYGRLYYDNLQSGIYTLEVESYQGENTSFTMHLDDATKTNQDFGVLSLPYSQEFNVSIDDTELDRKISYSFEITEQTGIAVVPNQYVSMELKDANGNWLGSGNKIFNEFLNPGTYELTVFADQYNNQNLYVDVVLSLRNSNATDQDLGVISSLPYTEELSLNQLSSESDSKINFNFETEKSTSFVISNNINAQFTIYDINGNYINSGYGSRSGTLGSGKYRIEVYNPYDNTLSNNTSLTISIQE